LASALSWMPSRHPFGTIDRSMTVAAIGVIRHGHGAERGHMP
jgi:hypothetical protein